MSKTALQWLGHSLLIAGTAHLAACAEESPVSPDRQLASAPTEVRAFATTTRPSVTDHRGPELGSCANLRVPPDARLLMRLYARGVQVYYWNGNSWTFDGPSAVLSADAAGKSTVGVHYAGPTWESLSGSKVVGTVLERCSLDPNDIPWLLLGAASTSGPGIFQRVSFIQRVNTSGGNAPSTPGSFTGEEARVSYTAEYFFYR